MTSRAPQALDGIEDEDAFTLENSGLDDREKIFVMAYLRRRNFQAAGRAAGLISPDDDYGSRDGRRVYERPLVKAAVDTLLRSRLKRLAVTPARIEQELAKVAFATPGTFMKLQEDGTAYIDFSEAEPEDLAGLHSFKCDVANEPGADRDAPRTVTKMEVRMLDKVNALTKLAQIHKMIGGDGEVTVVVDVADEIREARRRARLKVKDGDVE
jgi:hypothetical protein